jgi:N6-L-threonylcarbamoyladenine synthase
MGIATTSTPRALSSVRHPDSHAHFAALRGEQRGEARRELLRSNPQPGDDEWLAVTPKQTLDLLASFQATVIEELLHRAASSAETIGARSLIVSGGVACNSGLRTAAQAARLGIPVRFPTPGLSTDNAATIAAAAFPKYKRGEFADFTLAAQANLALA